MRVLQRYRQQNRAKAAFRESDEDFTLAQTSKLCNANAQVGYENSVHNDW